MEWPFLPPSRRLSVSWRRRGRAFVVGAFSRLGRQRRQDSGQGWGERLSLELRRPLEKSIRKFQLHWDPLREFLSVLA